MSEEEAGRLRGGGAVDDGVDKRGHSTCIVRDERVATEFLQQVPASCHGRPAAGADVWPAEPAVLRREGQCNDAVELRGEPGQTEEQLRLVEDVVLHVDVELLLHVNDGAVDIAEVVVHLHRRLIPEVVPLLTLHGRIRLRRECILQVRGLVHILRNFIVDPAASEAQHVAELRVQDDLEVELRWVLEHMLDGSEQLLAL